jgi:hypothetical protein
MYVKESFTSREMLEYEEKAERVDDNIFIISMM